MTVADMKKWLLKGSIADINYVLPAGIDIKVGILAGLNACDDEELESVGAKFGMYRKAGPLHWEGNTSFKSRLVDYVGDEVEKFRSNNALSMGGFGMDFGCDPDWGNFKTCNHKWKKYVGIMDAFEYCEYCDEKKR